MIKIFIDFDGTITRQDVGDALFVRFGGKKCLDYINEYRNEKISAVDCFYSECNECIDIDKNKLNEFLDAQEIDSSFIEFYSFCKRNDIMPFILSDGMDYYLDRILKNHGITEIPFFTNHLELAPLNGSLKVSFKPSFPFTDETCDRCACCKRNHMLTLSAEDDIIIYIGEGYSDRCPVHYADIVFAKDELQTYCQQQNVSYFEYRGFADITKRLEILLDNKQSKKHFGLKKRRQAQLAAREVFLGG